MTNIAQMVNVLQAMILTDKEKMLLTPTYHVFHMYKPFRGATQLPVELAAPRHKLGEASRADVHRSLGRARHATAGCTSRWSNLDPREAQHGDVQGDRARRREVSRAQSSPPPRWTRTTPSTSPRP